MPRVRKNEVGTINPRKISVGWILFDDPTTVRDFDGNIVGTVQNTGTARYKISFVNPMANTDYAVVAQCDTGLATRATSGIIDSTKTINDFEIFCIHHPANTTSPRNHISVVVYGDIA
jgi:hypothetical protein